MPEVIQDKQFGKQYVLRNAAKLVPLLVGFFFLVRGAAVWNADTLIAVIAFVIGILHWAWQDRQLFRSYYCPRCQRHLPQPTRPRSERREGDPITFYCPNCDVEWDTTLRQ